MVTRRARSLRPPALAARMLATPYRGAAAAVATLLLCAAVIHLHHTRVTFLELHFNVDGSCSKFVEYMQSSNNSKWSQFVGNSASAPRVTNLRPPCWYAHSIVHAMPLCPDFPEELEGALNMNNISNLSWTQLESKLSYVEEGGHWKPTHCRPRHRIAIIIPYRDRDHHLRVLLTHLHPFLQRQLLEYRIYVAEQDFGSEFNRGMMKNIGALYALQAQDFDCFYFHDVDLLPENDHNLYYCRNTPRHLSVAVSSQSYKMPYKYHYGGVITIMKEQFLAVNGYSNAYFQWGSEDDDLSKRIRYNGFGVEQNMPALGRYIMIPHKKDIPNDNRWRIIRWAHCRYEWDGLNSLHYKLVSLENRPLYTHIRVAINESQVMQNIPLPPQPPEPTTPKPPPPRRGPWPRRKQLRRTRLKHKNASLAKTTAKPQHKRDSPVHA